MHVPGRHHHISATEELQVVTPSKLAIENVSKSFRGGSGSVLALDRVSLNVDEGEFVCLVGASGCGKTTLLNMGGADLLCSIQTAASRRDFATW